MAELFLSKNQTAKNVAFFGDPQQINQKLLKFYIGSQKRPAHVVLNAENGAYLAHLEPNIYVIG
jgi:hypothetical protein